MSPRAQIRLLPDGRRLHLNDGPIDIVLQAFGPSVEIEASYRAAAQRFVTVLDELCGELTFLRQQTLADGRSPSGTVARRMVAAVTPFASENFITPMAAVAGAVAEEILEAMTEAANLTRAYVNDGGDIALHLSPGEQLTIGMIDHPDHPSLFGTTTILAHQLIRGIATSGRHGRSFSLGIADAVTVLAGTAAMADAAATIIANAVDLPGHPAITRVPACNLAPDTDLGSRLVTQAVGELTADEIEIALSAGRRVAEALRTQHLIQASALNLRGQTLIVGPYNAFPSMLGHPQNDHERAHAASADLSIQIALREGTAPASADNFPLQVGFREGTASAVPIDSLTTGASAPAGASGVDEAVHA